MLKVHDETPEDNLETSAKGSCGTEYFKGLRPGDVIGQIIDYLRSRQ